MVFITTMTTRVGGKYVAKAKWHDHYADHQRRRHTKEGSNEHDYEDDDNDSKKKTTTAT